MEQTAGVPGERVWLDEPDVGGWFEFHATLPDGAARWLALGSAQTMYIGTKAQSGAWARLIEGTIRPEWFGAGTVRGGDDTNALQASLDALGERASTLLLNGDYTISRRLEVRKKSGFRLAGPCKIAASSSMPVRSDYQCLMFDRCENFEITDLTIDGQSAGRKGPVTAAHALEIRSCRQFALRRVTVRNSVADCLYVAAASNDARDHSAHSYDGTFDDCEFLNGKRQGVSIIQGRNLRFSRCRFAMTTGAAPQAGVDLESNPRDLEGAIDDIAFTDCVFEGNRGYGLLVASEKTPRRIVARGCTFRGNVAGAVSWNGRDGLLEDCVFEDFDGARAQRGCIDVGAVPTAGWLDIVRPRIIGLVNQSPKNYFLYVHRLAGGRVRLRDVPAVELGYVAHLRAADCTIDGGEFDSTKDLAIILSGANCAVRNTTVTRFSGTVVAMSGDNDAVVNCDFLDPRTAAAGATVRVLAGQKVTIENNRFRGAGPQVKAIVRARDTSATIRANTFL